MTAVASTAASGCGAPVPRALPPRWLGLEAFGFVVGADGSATGASASGALAALGVVGRHLGNHRAPGSAAA